MTERAIRKFVRLVAPQASIRFEFEGRWYWDSFPPIDHGTPGIGTWSERLEGEIDHRVTMAGFSVYYYASCKSAWLAVLCAMRKPT